MRYTKNSKIINRKILMAVDLPPIPPAVVEFAQKNDLIDVQKNDAIPLYNGASVFYALPRDKSIKHGYYILLKDDKARLANPKEYCEISEIYL